MPADGTAALVISLDFELHWGVHDKRSVEAYLNRPREELYDLSADPDEVKNLAGDPAHAEVLAGLRKRLKEWQQATGDPWVVKYQHE